MRTNLIVGIAFLAFAALAGSGTFISMQSLIA